MLKEYILDRNIFEESIREIAKKEIILDLGGKERFHKALSKYGSIFKNSNYYCFDITKDKKVDIVGDIQELPFKDNSIDAIICLSVLEHLFEPQKAVEQIRRCLKIGGIAFFYLPFLHPYHGRDYFDGYRFSKDSLEYMFRNFSEMKLQPCGGYINTLFNFITGFRLKNRFSLYFLEKPLYFLIKLLRGRPVNKLHNPIGFNILLKK